MSFFPAALAKLPALDRGDFVQGVRGLKNTAVPGVRSLKKVAANKAKDEFDICKEMDDHYYYTSCTMNQFSEQDKKVRFSCSEVGMLQGKAARLATLGLGGWTPPDAIHVYTEEWDDKQMEHWDSLKDKLFRMHRERGDRVSVADIFEVIESYQKDGFRAGLNCAPNQTRIVRYSALNLTGWGLEVSVGFAKFT